MGRQVAFGLFSYRQCQLSLMALIVLCAGSFLHVEGAYAEGRYALVIGNRSYENIADLNNSAKDARGVAEKLESLGFDVQLHIDISEREFEQAIRDYGLAKQRGDVSLFYYAGHAIQYEGENYLVPTDAELQSVSDIELQLIRLGTILGKVQERGDVRLVFLDACRNNPFDQLNTVTRALPQTGLSAIRAEHNSFIAFATEPGNVAYDGHVGGHSPFTGALINHMGEPGLELSHLMIRVRDNVRRTTDGLQVPWDQSSLLEKFYFKPASVTLGQELDELNAILSLDDVDVQIAKLQDFQRAYPESSLASSASKTIESLRSLREGTSGRTSGSFGFGPNHPPILAAIPDLTVEAGSGAQELSIPRPRDLDQDRLEVEVQRVPTNGTLRQAGRQIKVGDRLSVEELLTGRYHPPLNYVGSAGQFAFRVHDGRGGSIVGALAVNVLQPNNPPTFEPPETIVATLGSTPIGIDDVAPKDPDPHDSVVVEIREAPRQGRLTLSGVELRDGQVLSAKQYTGIRYVPPNEYSVQPDVIELVAGDGRTETIRRVEISFNRPPAFGTNEIIQIQIVSDGTAKPLRIEPPTDPDGDTLKVVIQALPRSGGRLLLADRVLRQSDVLSPPDVADLAFEPERTFVGTAGNVVLRADDSFGASHRKTISLRIERANHPPTLRDPEWRVRAVADKETPLNLPTPLDRDGDELKVTIIEVAPGIRLLLNDRELRLGDALGMQDIDDLSVVTGSDEIGKTLSIIYGVDDQRGGWVAGRIYLDVEAPNNPPSLPPNGLLAFRADEAPVVLYRGEPPIDPDYDPLVVTILELPLGSVAHNNVLIQRGDRISVMDLMELTYSPPGGFDGFPGPFRYRVDDSRGGTVEGAIDIVVQLANRSPWTAEIVSFEIEGGDKQGLLRIPQPHDPDEDVLEIEVTELPAVPGLVISNGDKHLSNGDRMDVAALARLTISASVDSIGLSGRFRFRVHDGRGGEAEGGKDIRVIAPPNDPPVVLIPPKVSVVRGDGPQKLRLIEPTDPENGPLIVRLESMPPFGTVELNGLPLEPGAEIAGTDLNKVEFDPGDGRSEAIAWLRFLVVDELLASTHGAVPIIVQVPLNRPPVITSQSPVEAIVGIGPVPLSIEPPNDPDNDQLLVRVLGVPDSGRLMLGGREAPVGSEFQLKDLLDATFTPDLLPERASIVPFGSNRPVTEGPVSSLQFAADDGRGGISEGKIDIKVGFHDCDRLASAPDHADRVAPPVAFDLIETDIAIEACEQAIGSFDSIVRFQVQLGRAYHAAGHLERAVKAYSSAANSGDFVAQHNLAVLLLNQKKDDRPTKEDRDFAIHLLKMASEAGSGMVKRSLGLALLDKDPESAVYWLNQAIQAGDVEAKAALATTYYLESDVQRRPTVIDLLKQATTLGHLPAATNLGYLYASGLTGDPDLKTAAEWFRKAAVRGDIRAAINLARLERADRGLVEQPRAAAVLLAGIICEATDEHDGLISIALDQLIKTLEPNMVDSIRTRLRDLGHHVDPQSSDAETRQLIMEHYASRGLSAQADLSAKTLLILSDCSHEMIRGIQP